MPFHKELYEDLPPVEEVRKIYEVALKSRNEADGYYALVQDIATKYGDRAFDLAEEVFQQMGMKYDAAELRTQGKVRRVGYAFDGGNIYDVTVKTFEPAMAAGVVRVYRNVIRNLSREALIDQSFFVSSIIADPACNPEGILVATSSSNATLGFIHCCIDNNEIGSVELLAFYPGRMHTHVGDILVKQAREYFKQKNITEIEILNGKVHYPFYSKCKDIKSTFKTQLTYIYQALETLG